MAYVLDRAISFTANVLTASFTPDKWPTITQVDDDYILLFVVNDGGGTALSSPAGWVEHYKSAASISGVRCGIWSRKRSGSDVTAPTITGANDDWAATAVLIRDADPTTFLDVAIGTTEITVANTTPTAPAITPSNGQTLVLRFMGLDGSGLSNPDSGFGNFRTLAQRYENEAIELQVLGQAQAVAASTGTFAWTRTVSDGGVTATLAIRNKSGGTNPHGYAGGATVYEQFWRASPALVSISTIRSTIGGVATIAPSALTTAVLTSYALDPAVYGPYIQASVTPPVATGMVGFYVAVSSLDFNVNPLIFSTSQLNSTLISPSGFLYYFEDSAGNWRTWRPTPQLAAGNLIIRALIGKMPSQTFVDSVGSIDWTDITRFGVVFHMQTASATVRALNLRTLGVVSPMAFTGGGVAFPVTFSTMAAAIVSGVGDYRAFLQGSGQFLSTIPVQIGDGTSATYFEATAQSAEFEISGTTTAPWYKILALEQELRVKASSADTIDFSSGIVATSTPQTFVIDPASSTAASYSFSGASIIGFEVTWKTGITCSRASFSSCGEIDAKGAQFNDCVIGATRSTDAAITFDANSSMTGTTIDVAGTSAAYHLQLGPAVTAFTITNCLFSGTPGTDKIHVRATTGTVTITSSGSGLVAEDITSDGATVNLVAPTDDLTVTSTETGTLLQIFTSGTQTVLASTTGTSLVYTHSSNTVDIVVQKAGFIPQRVAGVALSGDVLREFTMVPDYNYTASHGLAYTTDASWSRTNNQLTVPSWSATRTVRNVYSLMIDAFIAETALRNTAFNLSMNGPLSLFLIEGAEGATDASITNMVGGGVRYLSVSEVTTAEWVGIQSQGVTVGLQPEYEQVSGGTIVNARATGDLNELIKMYGDATHGNFNYRGVLDFKVQANGYRQAEVDVLTSFGLSVLEPVLYIISLTTTAISGLTLGDPGASGLTLTDNSASPVSWDAGDGAKNYSITITDASSNSGETILRWLNYNLSLDATFQGKDPFFWPEMVIDNGAAYETLRGTLHRASSDVLAGVRVLRGGAAHPDFTRFQSDDGTYGTPTFVATASATVLADTRVQLYNVTTSTELDNSFVTGTVYSFAVSTGVTVGDTVRLIACKKGYLGGESTAIWTAEGVTFLINQAVWPSYTAWGKDGAAYATFFTLDGANLQIDANDVDGIAEKTDIGAYYSYALTTETGIRSFYGAITSDSPASIRVNVAVVDAQLQNINALVALRFTDINVRFYRSDGSTIIAPDSYTIHNDYNGEPFTVETGVSGLTGSESAQLMALPSAVANAAAVRTELGTELARMDVAVSTRLATAGYTAPANAYIAAVKAKTDALTFTATGRVDANIRNVNNEPIKGTGTEIDPWTPDV